MVEIAIPDPSCILLVGAAGSGKSTFAVRHFPAGAVVSSDAMRAAIGSGEDDQSVSRPAFAALHRSLDRRLASGRLTVVDATNLTAAARRAIRRIAQRHDVPVVAIIFDLPAPLVHERNAARHGRQVPETVVTRQLGVLRALLGTGQLASEGYSEIVHVQDRETLDRLMVRLEPRTQGHRQHKDR
ncbi:MAG: AAA family ATPase [Chloroflexi bacterium]|nr:AAA family ATPase [Chloroflexota bacterium]